MEDLKSDPPTIFENVCQSFKFDPIREYVPCVPPKVKHEFLYYYSTIYVSLAKTTHHASELRYGEKKKETKNKKNKKKKKNTHVPARRGVHTTGSRESKGVVTKRRNGSTHLRAWLPRVALFPFFPSFSRLTGRTYNQEQTINRYFERT